MSGCKSSEIIAKRTAKQLKEALAIATQRRNLGIRICDEKMNNKEKQPRGTQQDNSQQETTIRRHRENEVRTSNVRSNSSSTHSATDVEEQPAQAQNVTQTKEQKKKRGPTRMTVIPQGKKSWLEVSFNLGGQLCGPKSESFASFLGVLTRAHVPIVMSNWKDLKEKKEDELWSLLQPDNVKSKEDWDKFVKERLGAEFQKLSEKFKAMRKKQKYTYTMSRKAMPVLSMTCNLEYGRCQLLHWYNFELEQVVAEGHIASTDPTVKVHHMPIGRDCWKVWVDEVLDEELNLYRPTDEVLRPCLTRLSDCDTQLFDKDFEVQLTKFLKHVSA
ncbi:hypothetical protein L3X38_017251 [Prunus dulcis]|uniref:DUF8039 domain-containing protein n=1 Tax=Prunus dulcis TaxID=3755 RepID=A0AAD4W6S8_PRUDU|nr:hypothetical protein L3X38_017251 [Prunus dulcis]